MRKGSSGVFTSLLVSILFMGLLPAVSAADTADRGNAILTYEFDRWDEFSAPNNNIKSLYLSSGNIKYDVKVASVVEEGGVLTKTEEDKAASIETTESANAVQVDGLTAATSGLGDGSQLRISWEVAKADYNTEFTAWCNILGSYIFQLQTNGKVFFCGREISNLSWETNHWYQVDLILTIGTRNVDLYLDGQYIVTRTVNSNITSIGGLVFAAQKGSTSQPGKHWMDNIKLEAYHLNAPFRGLVWDGIENNAGVVPGKAFSVIAYDGNQVASNIELLLDGEQMAQTADANTLSVRLPADLSVGTHILTARATDISGNVMEQTITFTAREPLTEFTWTGMCEGITAQPGTAFTVMAQNEAFDITYMELLLDGESLASVAMNEVDAALPEELLYGSHTLTARVVDSNGGAAEESIAFVCALSESSVIYEADIANYKASKPGPGSISGMTFDLKDDFYIYGDSIDESRGNSIIIGSESKTTNGSPYLQRWLSGYGHDNIRLKTSIYMNDTNTSTTLVFRRDESIQTTAHPTYGNFAEDVIFYGNRLEYYEGITMKSIPLKTKTWYDVVFHVDLTNSTYSLWLTSEDGEYDNEPVTLFSPFRNDIHSTTGIRLQTRVLSDAGGWVAHNDYKLTYESTRPYLQTVAYEKDGQTVTGDAAATADTLLLFAGGTMGTARVAKAALSCEGISVPIGTVSVREQAFAVPVENLIADCDYQAELTLEADGAVYPVVLNFTVPAGKIGLEDVTFTRSGENVDFRATAKNADVAEQNVLVILTKFKQGKMVDIAAAEAAMTNGEAINVSLPYERGCEYRAVVRDGWDTLMPINHKIYTYYDVQ